MILIQPKVESNEPATNFAIEEFVARNCDIEQDYLFLYRNKPSVIIGKNQNPFLEIDIQYLNEQNIPMVRRISGGGTVFHDLGNLNFCFITKSTRDNFNRYTQFLEPIVQFLNNLGVPAEINKRNDIIVNGKKVSGNAQFTSRNRMFSHGTLLFNANLQHLENLLNARTHTISTKSTASVRSIVTNISSHIKEPQSIDTFKNELSSYLNNNLNKAPFHFTEKEWHKVQELAEEKFKTWEWNWGRTPKFSLKIEELSLELHIQNAIIVDIILKNKNPEILQLTSILKAQKYDRPHLSTTLKKAGLGHLLPQIFPFIK